MRYFFIVALLVAFLSPALAAPKKAEPLPDVAAIENYLNSITTLKSRFVQKAQGREVTGTFMLKRPGRLRFEYDSPIKDFIVADGLMIYYYDSKLKKQSSMPISRSLADFFLRKNMRLGSDIMVAGMKRVDNLLEVTLTQTRDPLAGTLTVMFSEKPTLQLKKWRIVDAQSATTEVELFDTQPGVKLNKELFHYYDPQNKEPNINN